MHVINK